MRPISGEEFERMLGKVDSIDDCKADPDAWKFYLCGLWTSGLRLTESLGLSWEPKADAISVDMGGKYPMLRIPSEAEKGGRDRLLPITPDFAALLQGVPQRHRRGRVFRVGESRFDVGPVVSAIGKAAGVVVDEDKHVKRKFASAHDLRRAFGQRWSRKVMPTILRELMRHSSIATTMSYYVDADAEATARQLWGDQETNGAPQGDHSGDHRQSGQETEGRTFAKYSTK
jgi:integrase